MQIIQQMLQVMDQEHRKVLEYTEQERELHIT